MRSVFLLVFSLMAGCRTTSELKGCRGGWVEFTWKDPKQCESGAVVTPRNESISSTENEWDGKGNIFLFRDTTNKALRVNIKQLAEKDAGMYQCGFSSGTNQTEKLSFADEKDGCREAFVQTAYRAAATTITCDLPGLEHNFLCKENTSTCEDIRTDSSSVFSVSISDVSSQHEGVYWCGVEPHGQNYRAGRKEIRLEVKNISTLERSPTAGQDFTYWCAYPKDAPIKKFICKGEDPSVCEALVTTQRKMNPRFSMAEKKKRNITITVRSVAAGDTGTYWCGANSTDKTRSNPFFNRLRMTVVSPPPPTSGGSVVVIAVAVCAAVTLLLLFVLISIAFYRRCSCSNNTRSGTTPNHIAEGYIYEEIPDRVPELDWGKGVITIYDTASLPTSPSASLHYCTVNFEANGSDKAGEAAVLKHSSACDYSTVNYSRSPADGIVNAARRASQDDLYSTVNKVQ